MEEHPVEEQRRSAAGAQLCQQGEPRCDAFRCSRSSGVSAHSAHCGVFISAAPPAGRSELDELQEEVQRRAREEEQQRRQEKEREAALGFNPRPSKYLDLDQLQIQGTNTHTHTQINTRR